MDGGNMLTEGSTVATKENDTNSKISTRFRIPCGIFEYTYFQEVKICQHPTHTTKLIGCYSYNYFSGETRPGEFAQMKSQLI